jgi:hypothetical protein
MVPAKVNTSGGSLARRSSKRRMRIPAAEVCFLRLASTRSAAERDIAEAHLVVTAVCLQDADMTYEEARHERRSERPAEGKETLDSAIQQAAKAITGDRDAVEGLRASRAFMVCCCVPDRVGAIPHART